MSVLIKNGRIITAADDYVADVFIDGERISLIGESLDIAADKVIDAAGKYVLPGCVDPHTHLDMPFGGTDDDRRRRVGPDGGRVRRHDHATSTSASRRKGQTLRRRARATGTRRREGKR